MNYAVALEGRHPRLLAFWELLGDLMKVFVVVEMVLMKVFAIVLCDRWVIKIKTPIDSR